MKDSFATLDLAPHGFDVLFDATWVRADYGEKGPYDWFQGDELTEQLAAGATPIAPLRIWKKP